MNAFAAALDAIFDDPNMALDGWHRDGEGNFTRVRVILRNPDEVGIFNDGRFVTDTTVLEVRLCEIASMAPGDTVQIEADIYEIRSEPRRDAQRMILRCEARQL
jgi:hypothetical protein